MTPDQIRVATELLDFHRCPNTGRVIHSTKGDDKAFCRCGRPNPALPSETPHAHFKEHMQRVSVEEFVEQEAWGELSERYGIAEEN